MKPDLVADVGNTWIKWGRCFNDRVFVRAFLPPDEPDVWHSRLLHWRLAAPLTWAVSGVHPDRRDRLAEWLCQRGDHVVVLKHRQQLGLSVLVDYPDLVGIDRLLNAVAASSRLERGTPAILIDAGTAVTVDWLDESGAFGGGAIFPGSRLMGKALRDYTALLPLVAGDPCAAMPGKSTADAIRVGIGGAVVGGIDFLSKQLRTKTTVSPQVFLTGGDARDLRPALDPGVIFWPFMTLEGLRIAAEHLP